MITGKDVNKDISLLELKMKNNSITDADIVKAITLLVKVDIGIRANLVAIMTKMGVKLREPRRPSKGRATTDAEGQENSDTTDKKK